MTYRREAGTTRTANLHYESAEEDAAYIASEVIRKTRSAGWVVADEELRVAAEIEGILAPFNIGIIHPGVWGWRQGGSKTFSR
jgi:hypothetical protein